MASTDVARVVPSQTSPAPAKLVKWSDRPVGCVVIVGWVVVAFLLQEFCVTRRLDWPAARGDRGAWITIASWRVASVVLAAGTCLGLALVHFTDPGVVPPNPRGVEADVDEYLATNRPIYVKRANRPNHANGEDAETAPTARDETKTTNGRPKTSRSKSNEQRGPTIELVLRYAKDWRGQPIRTIIPARLLHREDPEGPCLFDGRAPEFDPRCVTTTVRDACIVFAVRFIIRAFAMFTACLLTLRLSDGFHRDSTVSRATCGGRREPRTVASAGTAWSGSTITAPCSGRASRRGTCDGSRGFFSTPGCVCVCFFFLFFFHGVSSPKRLREETPGRNGSDPSNDPSPAYPFPARSWRAPRTPPPPSLASHSCAPPATA